MLRSRFIFRSICASVLIGWIIPCSFAFAQRDEGGRERDRGDDGERRSRDQGGGGGEGFRGGFGGGPPGGFGGGPPMGFGGGAPGGFGGGFSRGGFDPSSFIDRLDANRNGMLDPEEMQGPAGFMIQRLQRDDPNIRTDRPIPMSKLKEAFERMRGGSGGGGDWRGGEAPEEQQGILSAAGMLVPGFGGLDTPPPVPGFGAAAELQAVRVNDADMRQADETLRRYDRNRNNFIDADEISNRWEGNPMDFDQNRDNRLSTNELAVRYARRRLNQEKQSSTKKEGRGDRKSGEESGEIKVADRFEGRLSFRSTGRSAPTGLPGWFTDKDTDKDNQVRMSEYASQWTTELVEEFYGYDRNFDGVVTAQEAIEAVEKGPTTPRTDVAAPSRTAPVAPVSTDKIDSKYVSYAERIISRSDKNKDKELTASEWKDMIMDISPADADRNGRITVTEYAAWLQARAGSK